MRSGKFYCNLKNLELKKKIAEVYGFPDYKILENFFTAIIRIRNICSHNGVLYDFNQPVNIGKIPHKRYGVKTRNNNNLNASMKLILFILSKISVNRAEEMEQKLIKLFADLDCCEEVQRVIEQKINFDIS
ncbi:Abi family protein [Kaistella flava (ex Peng et al. 2021)]|uniref:Abi family protein n=1 Tax=Kaistella flava (ex Peng et al. 2021) TaxID=2038776 RepID=UPI00188115FC|nr:Abi family protein [Kaistella flava (ex Peng et al. 2021)]